MSLEAAIADLTSATKENTAILQQVLAGQKAALDKIDAVKGGGTKGGKPAPAATPPAKSAPKVVTDEQVKAAAQAWMAAATKGKSEADTKTVKSECAAFLASIIAHFGVGGKLTGPESKLDDDQRKQAKFFIERKAAGQKVDFSADYDFDGDPKQGAAAAEPEAEEDPLG